MPACVSEYLKRIWLWPALLGLFILQGCATHSEGFRSTEQLAAARNIPAALASLETFHKSDLSNTDAVLKHLNKGLLLHLQDQYAASNREFEAAKRLINELEAVSVREQAASVLVNEGVKAYIGDGNEQMLIHAFSALNYLEQGKFDEAAVEARQFEIKHRLIREKHPDEKYLTGAFVRYLNGMVYETVGEPDSARIEYHKALAGYREQQSFSRAGIPRMLNDDIARLGKGDTNHSGEIVFILENGLGPSLAENLVQIPNPQPQQGMSLLRIALPRFVERPARVTRVTVSASGATASSEMVEDINALAKRSLEDRLPGIKARAVARLLLKNQMVAESKKKQREQQQNTAADPMAKALMSIFSAVADIGATVSERADTRTWSLLPGNILMARLPLPAGRHDLTVTFHGVGGNVLGSRHYPGILVHPARKSFVADYDY